MFFCFLAGDANIILNMNWLAAATTLTVHTLFTCYPLKNWTPEGRMSDSCSDALHRCLQWMTYFTAACSFVFDPKRRPFTRDAEKVFFLSSRHFFSPGVRPCKRKSHLYWPTRLLSCWGSSGVYVITTPTWWNLQSDWTTGVDGQRCGVQTGGEAVLTDS